VSSFSKPKLLHDNFPVSGADWQDSEKSAATSPPFLPTTRLRRARSPFVASCRARFQIPSARRIRACCRPTCHGFLWNHLHTQHWLEFAKLSHDRFTAHARIRDFAESDKSPTSPPRQRRNTRHEQNSEKSA